MLNAQGEVAECTGDNIFIIRGGVVKTPDTSSGILQGITRDTVLSLARTAGFQVQECRLTPYDLYSADEAFLTGTAAEVIPMVTLDTRPIGSGTPGPITQQIIAAFREETKLGTPF